jgi:hypothetical protein
MAGWQGEIDTRDGVTHVVNPETPAEEASTFELRELWRVGGYDEAIMFGVINELLHDEDGNIYLLDQQLNEIMVFDADGEYLQSLGRSGEGPGEFVNGGDLYWTPAGDLAVIQFWPGKIVQITRDGLPAGEYKVPFRDAGFQVASRGTGSNGRIVLSGSAWTNDDGQQLTMAYLKAYDTEGNELAAYHENSREQSFGGWEFNEEKYSDFQRRWAAATDGRVAAALDFRDYRIHVWNEDGSLDRIIERPNYEPVRRTERERARFQKLFDRITSWNPGSTFKVSGVHSAVGRIFFHQDGSLWVQSSRDMWRAAEEGTAGFDVYDREGRFLRHVILNGDMDTVEDGIFLVDDRVYVVTDLFSARMSSLGGDEGVEEEPEPVSLIAYEFRPPTLEVSVAE